MSSWWCNQLWNFNLPYECFCMENLANAIPPFPVPFMSVLVNPPVRLVLLTAENGMKPTATPNQNLLQDLFQSTTNLFARTLAWPQSRVMRLPQQNSWCRPSPFWPALMSSTSLPLPNFQIVPYSCNFHHFLLGTPFPLGWNNGRSRLRHFCGLLHMRGMCIQEDASAVIRVSMWDS